MPIILTCDCGKKLKVNEDKIGKKVKCPGCQAVLSVPVPEAEDEPEAPVKTKVKPAPPPKVDPDDEAVTERAAKSKRKSAPPPGDKSPSDEAEAETPKKKKPVAEPKKSSGKLVLYGGLAAFLLLGLCGGGGGAIWYFGLLDFGATSVVSKKDQGKDGKKLDGNPPKELVIEPRGRFIAELGKDGDARSVSSLRLSSDGRLIAVSNANTAAQIWDLSGEPKKLRDFPGMISDLSPDAKRAVLYRKAEIFLVDAESGMDLAKLPFVRHNFFSSNNDLWQLNDLRPRKLVSVARYDARTGKKEKETEIEKKGDHFWPVEDKGEIFFVSKAREVHFWDLATEKWSRQLTLKPEAGAGLLPDIGPFLVSPDGKWLVVNAGQGTFDPAVYNLSTGDGVKLPKQEFFPNTPAFVQDRDLLLANKLILKSNQFRVATYDLKSNTVAEPFSLIDSISALAVSRDANTMVTGSRNGEVVIWDLKKLP